ncbi:biosynthetic peptidoglycan transglycosylase [Phaeobacter inhibens]|uniref:Monofunctional biosynthetic peptidoglycan transglycosylase n=1 Tax=Phaeobacter inhibens TaxID=221822 RepID=A0A2I7HZC1_9RHOB|nr:biosynthetic peptidoglycan transglycosylase [Phaeobacter inhibens]AUQ71194.1 monofunctional biosynthetic peptidoglycan transglycosylase [Phaeobacter inhibens]AUQ99769.1 monofunctional biosynthetic peptidoglycan transglycosylase [Phaeobacter inhibens]UWR83324.1 transglycosylase domain-containing protein [Phaeobacter inhibens]
MGDADSLTLGERYYPNHSLERDIGLAEYELASQRLSNQNQALSWSTNVSSIIATIIGFASFKISDHIGKENQIPLTSSELKSLFLLLILFISYMATSHIAHLIKSQTFSERKIIVIRRMLGVSYGKNTLVLPNWRIEGADNPFSIHLNPGIFSHKAFPVWIILASNTVSIIFLGGALAELLKNTWNSNPIFDHLDNTALIIIWLSFLILSFRRQLNEANENLWLWITKAVAKLFSVPLITNFEQKIYHIRLDIAEMHRLNTDTKNLRTFAVDIEDKEFFDHKGINWKGISRALINRVTRGKRSGGSSITQQFCRSNFITKLKPTLSRKLVEMLLAKWIECLWSKEEILEAYLASVRFDKGIYGAHRAYKHFFQDHPREISKWEAFIMIERLGNIRGFFLGNRVKEILEGQISRGVISFSDAQKALNFYDGFTSELFEITQSQLTPKEVFRELHSCSSSVPINPAS